MSQLISDTSRQLQQLNMQVKRLNNANQTLEVRRPDIGLIARLKEGSVQLTLTDNGRRRVFSIDLKDSAHHLILQHLCKSFASHTNERQVVDPKILLEHLLEVASVVGAISKPFLSSISQVGPITLQPKAQLRNGKLMALKGALLTNLGSQSLEIKDAASLEQAKSLTQGAMAENLKGAKLESTSYDLAKLNSQRQKQFREWLLAPLISIKSILPATPSKGKIDDLEGLEKILKEPLHQWKNLLWNQFQHHLDRLSSIELGGPANASLDELKLRARLQALIQQLITQLKIGK
jgi:hypothetical protein